jgi:pterin-4a-carbinolamine dehydratase
MKMADLMRDYFEKENRSLLKEEKEIDKISLSELPVKPKKKSTWTIKQYPKRFHKIFRITSYDKYINFVVDILRYEAESKHNAKIVLGFPDVIIQVWTHTLEDITEADQKYTKEVDKIYEGI